MKTKSSSLTLSSEQNLNYGFFYTDPLFTKKVYSISKPTKTEVEKKEIAEILFLTSYPPRECGIATYSQDLILAINNKFSNSLSIKVCALESGDTNFNYPEEVKFVLKTSDSSDYETLAEKINNDEHIKIVLIQHEFGFFKHQEKAFQQFLETLTKPAGLVFHTVLPQPNELLRLKIKNIAEACEFIIVMTHTSENILIKDYGLPKQIINVIAHGTHLVQHESKKKLKEKFGLLDRKVLSTFGLLSSGKSIETTLDALPAIIKECPEVIFLIIGKTHPEVVKSDGENYRYYLEDKVKKLEIQNNVKFINSYLALPELLEYLQLTDIYLFTSNDPNQAVSGTFVYAMSCACPIISTPIPHAKEILTEETGIIFDFNNHIQLAGKVISLFKNEQLRKNISLNTLQKIISTSWENSAVAHAILFENISGETIKLKYKLPVIKLDHVKRMTDKRGIIQFSKINQPDIKSGYTLDDNARALISMSMYYKLTLDDKHIPEINKYIRFIKFCQQPEGNFLNYVDKNNMFTSQNETTNLEDSNGRAIWALGYVISLKKTLPESIISEAVVMFDKAMQNIEKTHSTRSMAFIIKGLYFYQSKIKKPENLILIKMFANRLLQMYKHESKDNWEWFESYLTYANSILPEALLYAWLLTNDLIFKETAITSFNFLLSKTFNEKGIEVISNKKWLKKGQKAEKYGEQPIDVAYTIITLSKFLDAFNNDMYREKMEIAFNWFLGQNHLNQTVYNPCTGGCYDGVEEFNVNLNQGAESTLSYLMARLVMENYRGRN